MRRFVLIITVLSLIFPPPCFGCLWDSDTLAMERRRFPKAHELIVGHFIRHSPAYYQWRVSDRTTQPIEQRQPSDFDDIAVAYDKLGQHDKAIETILAKIERYPHEGRYESEANLGTFYIHAGRFEDGLQHISKAIEINPEAHFGREIYQKLLVEYVIQSRLEDDQLPLNKKESFERKGFTAFVLAARSTPAKKETAEIQAAAKGIMGMMRFGNYDSPILLEALGDLLMGKEEHDNANDSKMLAARAYLKASYEVDDSSAANIYRKKAERALELQSRTNIDEVETELKSEIEQAESFGQKITADEQMWIDSEKDVDEEFANQYYQAPRLNLHQTSTKVIRRINSGLLILGGVMILIGTRFGIRRMVRGKRKLTTIG